jgi:hypothetical protein
MKSFKMKALSLAVLGLAGFGMTNAAFACDNTNLSAWTGTFTNNSSAVNVVAGGLEATPSACKMTATLGGTAVPQNATGIVFDNTPGTTAGGEPRYRARFYFNVDPITGTNVNNGVQANLANIAGLNTANGFNQLLRVFLKGNSTHGTFLRLQAACTNSPTSDNLCRADLPVLTAGNHYVEVDVQTGASGYVNYWLDQDATNAANTGARILGSASSTTINNSAWGGVIQYGMGVGGGSPNYRTSFGAAVLSFDAFDSRRVTAIGP